MLVSGMIGDWWCKSKRDGKYEKCDLSKCCIEKHDVSKCCNVCFCSGLFLFFWWGARSLGLVVQGFTLVLDCLETCIERSSCNLELQSCCVYLYVCLCAMYYMYIQSSQQ